MKEIIESIAATPIPTILVIFGLALLILSLGVQIKTSVVTTDVKRTASAIVGTILILIGCSLYLAPVFNNIIHPKKAEANKKTLIESVKIDEKKANKLMEKSSNIELTYQIVSKNSFKCFDMKNRGLQDGVTLQQWECVNHDNQKWILKDTKDGFHQIVSKHSKKCLDVKNRSMRNGATVQQWQCVDHDNQKWLLKDAKNGSNQIISKNSNKCLDIKNRSKKNGTAIQLWDCVDHDNQNWIINKL